MTEYEFVMSITLDPAKLDEFLEKLVALAESLGGELGGGLVPVPEVPDEQQTA
jgi:hypothetical protein